MILKLRIGHFRFSLSLIHVLDVVGINSVLPDGNHILMWDFDDKPLDDVKEVLKDVQDTFNLPMIYILQTSQPNNYIAYCFHRCTWQIARAIIGYTPLIDENFFKWAVLRGRFTLRVGPKYGRIPILITTLPSKHPETVSITELKSWVKYETLRKDIPRNIIEIGA